MNGRLKDKVAIITGGSTGIGEAVSHKFSLEGAKILVNGLPGDPVDDVVDTLNKNGGNAAGYKGDISEVNHATNCVKKAVERFGKIDILINNAGTFQTVAGADDFPPDEFDYMVRMNIRTLFLMTKYALPYLRKTRGCIISTGSEAGLLGQPRCAPYGGTKGFIHGFMRSVALEQAKNGIRANCVCPGPIDTQWHDTSVSPMTDEMESDILNGTPMGRRGLPEEAANVFAFLASDEASFITGALYFVDGGISISRGPLGSQVPDDLRKPPDPKLKKLKHSKEGLENKIVHYIP
jgi:NAD(P)-dependent dehydrogenase (short-subunit alcohol dehydrogenase family)